MHSKIHELIRKIRFRFVQFGIKNEETRHYPVFLAENQPKSAILAEVTATPIVAR